MDPYLKREEFELSVTNDISEFFNKHAKNIGELHKREFTSKIDTFFGRNTQLSRLTTEIGVVSKLNLETVEMLIRATLEFSYNNYKVIKMDMERKNRELSSLRKEHERRSKSYVLV
jgi:hypothetical protein